MSPVSDTYCPKYTTLTSGTGLKKIMVEQIGEAYVSPDVSRGLQQCGYPNFSYEDCDEERYRNMLGEIEATKWADAMFVPQYDFSNPDCLIFKGSDEVSKLAQPRKFQKDPARVAKIAANIKEVGKLKYPIIAVWVDGKIYIAAGWHRAEALRKLGMKAPLILVTGGSRNQRTSLLCDLANFSNAESADDVATDKSEDIRQGAENFFTTLGNVDLSCRHLENPVRVNFAEQLDNARLDLSSLEAARKEVLHYYLKKFKNTYYTGLISDRARDSQVTKLHNLIFSGETHPQLFNYDRDTTVLSEVNDTLSGLGLYEFEPSTNEGHRLFGSGVASRLFSYQMEKGRSECIEQNDPQWLKNQGPMTLCKTSEKVVFDSRLNEINTAVEYFTSYNKGHTHHGRHCNLFIDNRFQDAPNPTVNRLIFPQRFNDARDRCFIFIWNNAQMCFDIQNGPLPKTEAQKKADEVALEEEREMAAMEEMMRDIPASFWE